MANVKGKIVKKIIAAVFVMLISQDALADWLVDPESSHLGFASVKNEVIGENHHFTSVSGNVSDAGMVSVIVALSSVETMIPIRNERMQSMLFDVTNFPLAVISGQVDTAEFTALPVGGQLQSTVDINISLHGSNVKRSVLTKVVRSSEATYEVSSLGPVLVNATEFKLSEGVEALREIAGLQTIDLMVPVTFDLTFKDR